MPPEFGLVSPNFILNAKSPSAFANSGNITRKSMYQMSFLEPFWISNSNFVVPIIIISMTNAYNLNLFRGR